MVDPSSLLLTLGSAAAPHATNLVKRIGKSKYDKIVATYTNVFQDHLAATVRKCSRVKSFLHRDTPLDLRQQYVNISFTYRNEQLTDIGISQECKKDNIGLVVSGLAGTGKSMFMKWLSLELVDAIPSTQKIPIFIEMREIGSNQLSLPIDQIIFLYSSSDNSTATFNQLHVGLSEGMFIIIIDGLDEIPPNARDGVLTELSDFQRRFPKSSLICSTRPDQAIETNTGLVVLRVNPMSLEQVSRVIQNAVFDEEKKQAFILELEGSLYAKHTSFLSNPLLAIIMLVTFDISSEVPSRLSLFYSQVFEALFYKHDSSKGVYTRDHFAKLDIDQFSAAFRSFCFQSYAMSKLTFEMADLMELVRKSLMQVGLSDVSPSLFIKDCLHSLSLLQEDGLYISFVHRSFQEFFAAKFVLFYSGEHYFRLVEGLVARSLTDSSLKMLCEMNPDSVLRRWAIPKISEILSRLNLVVHDDSVSVTSALRELVGEWEIDVASGEVGSYTWVSRGILGDIHALNLVFETSGLPERILVFPDFLIGSSEEDFHDAFRDGPLSGTRLEQLFVTANSNEQETFRLSLNESDESWILKTNLGSSLENLQADLHKTRVALEKKFDIADSFTGDLLTIFAA